VAPAAKPEEKKPVAPISTPPAEKKPSAPAQRLREETGGPSPCEARYNGTTVKPEATPTPAIAPQKTEKQKAFRRRAWQGPHLQHRRKPL
jgi:hypothetical protein